MRGSHYRMNLDPGCDLTIKGKIMSRRSGRSTSKLSVSPRRCRLLALLAGALVLVSALYGYRLYSQAQSRESAGLSSIPRLQISAFKVIYDRSLAPGHKAVAASASGDTISSPHLYIIDVRSRTAYEEGHIRGAVSIQGSELEGIIKSVVPPSLSDALIVLYCA